MSRSLRLARRDTFERKRMFCVGTVEAPTEPRDADFSEDVQADDEPAGRDTKTLDMFAEVKP